MAQNYPFEIRDLDPDETKQAFKYFPGSLQDGFIRIGPKGYYFTAGFKVDAANIYNMPLRPDDTFIVSFPKTGTTWTQELVWMISNNFDYEKSKSVPLPSRFPFIEISMLMNGEKVKKWMRAKCDGSEKQLKILDNLSKPGTEIVAQLPSPRFLKTHVPLSLLPPALLDTCKVIYVARDPRDVVVSYHFHNQLFTFLGYNGELENLWELFKKNMVNWSPILPHMIEAWEKKDHPNMLFLFYEDMIKDLPKSIRRVADFLGKEVTEEQMTKLCDHLSFQNFKNNKSVNLEMAAELGYRDRNKPFMREGKSGGWRRHFTPEMCAQAQQWLDEGLRGTDLRFPN